MRICVTGGCGYKGSVLVPKLLKAGHYVRVIDAMWFANYLRPHPKLNLVRADIREPNIAVEDIDAVIHLAAVANDPTGDLDPKLTWEVNALATAQLIQKCAAHGVQHFIYASSGSVYGVSDAPEVTEDAPLVPLSEYNKTKLVAERVVLSYSDRMVVQVIRPATVCGYSPRFRADVLVNMLTMRALADGKIHLLSPNLYRPNVHIQDIADLYIFMLGRTDIRGIYNAGFENLTVRQVADMVAQRLDVGITQEEGSKDIRSYRINSDKLLETGFKPKQTVADAINEIVLKYESGQLKDEARWHNLRWMQRKAA